MPRLSVACVRLQRVPPDMRILTPGRRFFSNRSTRRPSSAARAAATRPAAPAPITTTSQTASDMIDDTRGVALNFAPAALAEAPAKKPIPQPPADEFVQCQQGPDEARQQRLATPAFDQPHNPVDALLDGPDAEGWLGRPLPLLS